MIQSNIIVIGEVCSGKTTYIQNLPLHIPIDIGAIVREIVDRSERVHNKLLDTKIIEELSQRFELSPASKFVIVGIRQLSILKYLLHQFKEDVQLIYLDVPYHELKRRFLNRSSRKEEISFEDTIRRDGELGLNEVREFLLNSPNNLLIIKN